MPQTLHFQITCSMVDAFSRLTGDHNPLHVDVQFARRTHYREPIAQGMLVYAFASLLMQPDHSDRILVPIRMKAQFLEPIPIGAKLVLSADRQSSDTSQEYHFTVTRKHEDTVVLKGTITGRSLNRREIQPVTRSSFPNDTLLIEKFEARYLTIDDIQKNDTETFPFRLDPSSTETLVTILRSGVIEPAPLDVEGYLTRFYFPNLTAAMILSTSVGMYCPGQLATFLDFDVHTTQLLPFSQHYQCHSTVRHVSQSTRMIKKEIKIDTPDADKPDEILGGYVHAAVNLPPTCMPDIEELKTYRDLGIENRVALITGASRGIGETIAKTLALHGASIVVNYYRGQQDAKRVVDEINSIGGRAIAVQADVRDEKQVEAMVAETIAAFGTIHILVNNAVGGFKPYSFERLTWDNVQSDIDVVVKGAFNCCRFILPLMVVQKFGKVINIGTVATDDPPVNQLKYVIAKSGLVGLTRSLSIEYAARNIQINMVVPNFVETDLVAHVAGPYRKKIASDIPMQRAASPIDIAQTVVYLASSYSGYMTGQKTMVTGGGAPYS